MLLLWRRGAPGPCRFRRRGPRWYGIGELHGRGSMTKSCQQQGKHATLERCLEHYLLIRRGRHAI